MLVSRSQHDPEQSYATWQQHGAGAGAGSAHAVALTADGPSRLTLCGETVKGPLEEWFDRVPIVARCPHCAQVLGASHG
jgi:hypothetical protein